MCEAGSREPSDRRERARDVPASRSVGNRNTDAAVHLWRTCKHRASAGIERKTSALEVPCSAPPSTREIDRSLIKGNSANLADHVRHVHVDALSQSRLVRPQHHGAGYDGADDDPMTRGSAP